MAIGIIGGTGLYALDWVGETEQVRANTPYGEATCFRAVVADREVFFLPRHGVDHATPPHRINYRANIRALQELGATVVFASSACGSLTRSLPPGRLALPDQFLDFTKLRPTTFFDGAEGSAIHVDVTEPYCPRLRAALADLAKANGVELADRATYVCAEGPRFETPAEIRFYANAGGELVGMTGVPECTLAREAELCYATVSVVTNFAAGLSDSRLTHGEVVEVMGAQLGALSLLLQQALSLPDLEGDCPCRHALDEYREMGVLPPRSMGL
jgi:5'-methylthioadenosine phosphorylase